MTEEKRCGSCTWWEQRTDFKTVYNEDVDQKYRRCEIVPMAEPYETPPDPLPLAVAMDGSEYRADLYTLADFGCVQWAPITPPKKNEDRDD
jgi:hypothetical protein